MYIPLPLHATVKLFDEDKNATYFSENNRDFLEETGVIKHYNSNDVTLCKNHTIKYMIFSIAENYLIINIYKKMNLLLKVL